MWKSDFHISKFPNFQISFEADRRDLGNLRCGGRPFLLLAVDRRGTPHMKALCQTFGIAVTALLLAAGPATAGRDQRTRQAGSTSSDSGERAVPRDTSPPSRDTSTPSRDTSTPSRDTSTPSRDTSTPSRDTTTPSRDTSTPSRDTTTP